MTLFVPLFSPISKLCLGLFFRGKQTGFPFHLPFNAH
jgi:hypothetical protein